jgi:hypothetical protein
VAARKEAELREIAEMQARQLVERFTGNLPQSPPQVEAGGREKFAIALYAGIAVVLLVLLFLIIYALIQYV